MISLNSTVLDMKVMDSKSNGALTWNSETNIECKENFQQPFYPSSSEYSHQAGSPHSEGLIIPGAQGDGI